MQIFCKYFLLHYDHLGITTMAGVCFTTFYAMATSALLLWPGFVSRSFILWPGFVSRPFILWHKSGASQTNRSDPGCAPLIQAASSPAQVAPRLRALMLNGPRLRALMLWRKNNHVPQDIRELVKTYIKGLAQAAQERPGLSPQEDRSSRRA